MTGAPRKLATPALDPVEAFRARCEADAERFARGELTLQDAVDRSQNYAVAYGLIEDFGQDACQQIISGAFGSVR